MSDVSAGTPEKKKKHVHSSLVFELLEVLVMITCQHDGDPPHHTMSLLRTSNEARVAVYVLRLEVLHTLLVLLSTRLYRSSSSSNRESKTITGTTSSREHKNKTWRWFNRGHVH